jgi:iron complex outermembrane receptor protein
MAASLVLGAAGASAQVAPAASAASAAAVTSTLPGVTVTGKAEAVGGLQKPHAGGQVARGGSIGILGSGDAMDQPFSTTNFTSELMEDQQARTLADVVSNDASVRVLTSSAGFGEDFQIRGFAVPSGDVGLNGLYGLTSASRMPVEITERVEVLKGPGSLANGISPNGSIGGGVNIVTKRAGDVPLTRLTTSYLGQSQFGTHLDVGRRFGEDNAWGIRVNGAWRDGEITIKDGNQKLGVASIGLDYLGSRLRWSFDAFTQREDLDEVRPQIAFAAANTSIPAPPSARTNFYPGSNLEIRDSTATTRLEYDITDQLTAYGGIGYRDGKADQLYANGQADTAGNFRATSSFYDSYSKTTTGDVGLRARFATAGVRHTVSLGYSRLEQELGNFFLNSTTTTLSNIYNPSPIPVITGARLEPGKASEQTLSSVALVDTLSFADDRVLLTLGLRDQTVELDNFNTTTGAATTSYKASSVSPLAGVVFKPVGNVSLYANYTKGLTRGSIAPATAANAGEVFPPFKSDQYEAGVKVDWGTVTTIASVYQIKRPNALTDTVTNIYSLDGEQRNRGFELAAYGELTRGLRLMGGAALAEAKQQRTAGGTNQGKDVNGVPHRTFTLGADWDTPWLPGFTVNGRVINTSEVFYNAANTLRLPGYTRTDIGARYRTVVAGKPVVFRATVENLFDRNYWLQSGAYVSVAAPRRAILSAAIDF